MVYRNMFWLAGVAVVMASCNSHGIEGKWHYAGGVYGGKKEGSTEGYQLERNYTGHSFEAFMLEEGTEPKKYQAGDYEIKGDTCIETETYSTQPSKLTNVGIHYNYHLQNDSMILKGTLPTGMKVEEYWTRVK